MKEEDIDSIPFGTYPEPLLASYERKVVSQFQEKLFQFPDQCFFQLRFGAFVLQAKELKDKWIFDLGVGRILSRDTFGWDRVSALIGEGGNLAVELANGPPTAKSFRLIMLSSLQIGDGKQTHIVRPG